MQLGAIMIHSNSDHMKRCHGMVRRIHLFEQEHDMKGNGVVHHTLNNCMIQIYTYIYIYIYAYTMCV